MAVTAQYALWIVLLLNVVFEVHGQTFLSSGVVEIDQGDHLDPCILPKLEYTVEFQQVQFNSSRIYHRTYVRASAVGCLADSPSFNTTVRGTTSTLEDCIKNSANSGDRTFVLEGQTCTSLTTSVPQEFQHCPDDLDGDDYEVVYTTSDVAPPFTLPDQQEFLDCDVVVDSTNAGFTVNVEDSGDCTGNQYRVTYDVPPGENHVLNTQYVTQELPSCKMLNFTIYRELDGVPLGTDDCVASTITKPGPITLTPGADGVDLNLPTCDLLEYTITLTNGRKKTVIGQGPLVEGTITTLYSDIGTGSIKVTFTSDVRMKVPAALVYPAAR